MDSRADEMAAVGLSADDLTGRARIRDAALIHFAEYGTAGATLRSIAEAAGVSAGLVRHHFGSKDGLREACDQYVIEFLRRETAQGIDNDQMEDPAFIADMYRHAPPLMRYMARALVDGSPAAARMFDEIVAVTERYLSKRSQARGESDESDHLARAVVVTAMRLGVTVLHQHVSRALGDDIFSADTAPRVGRAVLDVLVPDLVGPSTHNAARHGLDLFDEEKSRDN